MTTEQTATTTETETDDDGIRHALIDLRVLAPHPHNYRRHPTEQVRRIATSLSRFGQVRSIVVQQDPHNAATYTLVAGEGVYRAALRLGFAELAADIIPASWTPEQVTGYLIADNESERGALDDTALLARLLQEQAAIGYDLASLGYDPYELDALLAAHERTQAAIMTSVGESSTADAADGASAQQQQPQPQPQTLRHDGSHAPTPDERFERYLATELRQIVLILSTDEYAWALARLRYLSRVEGLETNTDVVLLLLRRAVDDAGIDVHSVPTTEEREEEAPDGLAG